MVSLVDDILLLVIEVDVVPELVVWDFNVVLVVDDDVLRLDKVVLEAVVVEEAVDNNDIEVVLFM